MSETAEETIARLESRLERLKRNMLSGVTRPRIIAGAVAMEEARRNRDFAAALLAAFDRGQDRMVDRKSIDDFVSELERLWDLADRPTVRRGAENIAVTADAASPAG